MRPMWRSFFLAIGIAVVIFGGQFLVLDKLILSNRFNKKIEAATDYYSSEPTVTEVPREFIPEEWTPWSLLSVGAIVILYSQTLKRQ